MQDLGNTVGCPQFSDLVREIEAQPVSERQAWTQQNASVEAMQARGIPITNGNFRSAVRIFEVSEQPTLEYDTIQLSGPSVAANATTSTLCTSLGCVLCISYGKSWESAA